MSLGFQSINSTSRGHVQSHFAALFFAVNDCWSIAAFQCCTSFYSTAKWTSYTQIPVSIEPWAEVPEPQYVLPSYLFYTQHQRCLCVVPIAQFVPLFPLDVHVCALSAQLFHSFSSSSVSASLCLLHCAWAFLQLQQGGAALQVRYTGVSLQWPLVLSTALGAHTSVVVAPELDCCSSRVLEGVGLTSYGSQTLEPGLNSGGAQA